MNKRFHKTPPAPIEDAHVTRRPKDRWNATGRQVPTKGEPQVPFTFQNLRTPILEICRHPDRNRLLAEFSEY